MQFRLLGMFGTLVFIFNAKGRHHGHGPRVRNHRCPTINGGTRVFMGCATSAATRGLGPFASIKVSIHVCTRVYTHVYTRVYTQHVDTRVYTRVYTRGDDTRGDDTRGDDTRDDTSVLLVTWSIQCYQAHFESGRSSLNRIFCCCCC